MSGPWEKYQKPAAKAKPWEKYQAQAQVTNPAPDPALAAFGGDRTPITDSGVTPLSAVGRTLDFPSGIARTAVAGLANIPYSLATGKSLTKPEDLQQALLGEAPSTAQYMERAGVAPGATAETPIGNISARDVAGFVGDVALDPITFASKGIKAADLGAEALGKTLYKSGLKKVDQAVVEKGAKPLSDLLLENGVRGSVKDIRQGADSLLRETKAGRDTFHAVADAAGAKVDPKIALAPALEEAKRIGSADPGLKDLSEKLTSKLQTYIDHGPVPTAQASEWKTNLYNSMPESAFDQAGRMKGPAKKIESMSASGLKAEIQNAGNAAKPGLGDSINQANEKMQTLLSAKKPLQRAAKAAKNVNAVTSVDMMLGAGAAAASHDPLTTAAVLAAKKLGDVSKTTGFRTTSGYGLRKIGQSGAITPLVNRAWIDMQRKKDAR
jgi:hypothetical protein